MKSKNFKKLISLLSVSSILSLLVTSCYGVVSKVPVKDSGTLENTNKNPEEDKQDINNQSPSEMESNNKNNNTNNSESDSNNGNESDNIDNSGSSDNDGSVSDATDNTESDLEASNPKMELDNLIKNKATELAKYTLYYVIKASLEAAYTKAEGINSNNASTQEQIIQANNELKRAISQATTSKDDFDTQKHDLITAFNELKAVNDNTSISSIKADGKYAFVKQNFEQKLNKANELLSGGYQRQGLDVGMINDAKNNLNAIVTNFSNYGAEIDEFSAGKAFAIDPNKITSTKTTTNEAEPTSGTSKTNNIYSADISIDWKYATRRIKNGNTWETAQDSKWVYNLLSENDKYEFMFNNYSSSQLKLIFPYKLLRNSEKNGTKLVIKLNDQIVSGNIDIRKSNILSLAQIDLTNVPFGQNKLTFTTENSKKAPLISNIYLLSNKDNIDSLIYKINGQTKEGDEIKIDLFKAFGGSTSLDSYFEKKADMSGITHNILYKVGKGTNSRYSIGVYVEEAGNYLVGISYNWKKTNSNTQAFFHVATFNNNDADSYASGAIKIDQSTQTGDNDVKKIEPIHVSGKNDLTLTLNKGWNPLVLGKRDTNAFPNLEYIYLKKVQATETSTATSTQS
ncbi:hypothetical protein [Mycoplasma bradburyae]|uniref:hypothetical protein n=1 Tax=Mycoplasma bradburyae TaxID=2963128 RepID=UPI0023415508|nr:hypothetical protein [Mycoplasma bradburyae]MDC4182867.1 hypothetical protein [Mycoplasma bradburyae]